MAEDQGLKIVRKIVAEEGTFVLGFVTQVLPLEIQDIAERKQKQLFRELWDRLTPEQQVDVAEEIDATFQRSAVDYWQGVIDHYLPLAATDPTAELKVTNAREMLRQLEESTARAAEVTWEN